MMMSSDAADRYLRSGVRWVFIIYTLPLFMSLVLAAFEPTWGAATFIALGLLVVITTIDTGWRMLKRGGSGNSMTLVVNQWTCTVAVVVLVALPWIIGGWVPPATAYIPSLLIALAAGFASTAALIMTQFDATAAMAASREDDDEPAGPRH